MVQNRVRKTTMGQHSLENMQEAVALVESGLSLRVAANRKHVNYTTLSHLSRFILTETIDQDKAESFLKDQLSEYQPNLMNFQVKHPTPIKDDQLVSPIACRGYPKAQPRLQSNKGRKRERSCIATGTPIKMNSKKLL
ncbi:hypothetical protein ILUMI_22575 [Ignelater luminosus]|uniref:HTH psq-type domain-containing protein n=1 Tax=Ignelater luminosus TaxID=2038154 RepID=A0A8K0CFK3_IGNLU|nr:hypothetical protein ILUMI_22575 [Ignelater luminosus]